MTLSARPVLIFDCYIELPGAAQNFIPLLGETQTEVCLAAHGEFPENEIGAYGGVIVTGSAASVCHSQPWIDQLAQFIHEAHLKGVPILGVCFGHQLLAAVLGGRVQQASAPEVGTVEIDFLTETPINAHVPHTVKCFVSHEDEVVKVGVDCEIFAQSQKCAVQAFRHQSNRAFGIQFHPEMPVQECYDLLCYRAVRHPNLALNVEEIHAGRVEQSDLANRLFGNFMRLVRSHGL